MKMKFTEHVGGFTLLEMVIAVIIIGILASLAIGRYEKTVERSRIAEALSVLGAIRTAQFRYASEHNRFTDDLARLDMNVSSQGKFFTFSAVSDGTPFDGSNNVLANATRDSSYQGGRYGSCVGYSIAINEGGNFTSPNCVELNSVLN